MNRIYKYLFTCLLAAITISSSLQAQQPAAVPLTAEEKLFGLSHIWSEAKYNFVYFDKLRLNWDSLYRATIPRVLESRDTRSYYDELRRFTAALGDGHTSVWYPGSFYQNEFAYAPLATDIIQGRVFITGVLNDSLLSDGWQRGMEILKINGADVHAYAQQHLAPYEGANTPQGHDMLVYKLYLLNGPVSEPLVLTLKDLQGRTITKILNRNIKRQSAPAIQFTPLPGKVGLLTINHFSDGGFYKKFDNLYTLIQQTEALIIDLRQNTGGDGGQGEYILKHISNKPIPEPQVSAIQYNPLLKVWGQTNPAYYTIGSGYTNPFNDRPLYQKQVLVLVSKQTVSAAEDFTMQFDALQRGLIIGQPTAGSTGQPMLSSLPGGGTFRVCVRKDTYPDGKIFVAKGIQPTVVISENAEAFRQGRDLEMEKALELVKGSKNKTKQASIHVTERAG